MEGIGRKPGFTVWITGLSGSGKSTLGRALHAYLTQDGTVYCLRFCLKGTLYDPVNYFVSGTPSYVLDGDQLRGGLSQDLGYSAIASEENARRAGEVALMFAKAGFLTICCLISPSKKSRRAIRARHAYHEVAFHEVYLKCSLSKCQARDPKGWYAKYEVAKRHFGQITVGSVDLGPEEIRSFLDDSFYEIPDEADLTLDTETLGVSKCLNTLINYLNKSNRQT